MMLGMGEWHPIMAAVEVAPAVWSMRDQFREYGRIELRRTGDGPRYRTEHEGVLIGWASTLRVACSHVHGAYLRSLSPSGHPEYPSYSYGPRLP